MGIIQMSKKEIYRLEMIIKVANQGCSYREASNQSGLSKRQLIRLVSRYRQGGVAEITHRGRGKPSQKKIAVSQRQLVNKLIRSRYEDFGPSLATEQLLERHNLRFSREWVRQLMIEEGIWKVHKLKELTVHQRRQRRSQEGELIQVDGSYEDWFEGRAPRCCLLVAIDDATSKLQELRFVVHESREDYFALMKQYITRLGRPVAIYTDRHSVFKTTRAYDVYEDTQFGRAMKELDVELIHANTPQAKGRVERANSTLQDRLIKLMRLDGISSMEAGNIYLEKFRGDHNKKFAKKAKDPTDKHRNLSKEMDLDKILCVKEKRKLSKQLTVQFENRCYQVQPAKINARRLVGASVLIYHAGEGVVIERGGIKYAYTIYEEMPKATSTMDRKELTAFLDRKKPLTIIARHRKGMRVNF